MNSQRTNFAAQGSRVRRKVTSLFLVLALTAGGCANLSKTEKGAAAGAGAGAVVGGVIGKVAGSTAKGAIAGAIVGGAAGAIIGRQMDKQAAELDRDLENADVQRIGEGIVVTFDSGVLFDFDSATLRSASRENLRDLAESLNGYDNTEVLAVGHTDDVGANDYNLDLSQRRARAATAYLMDLGLRPSRVKAVGKGETEPIATNETEAGRQQNRRVEIAIYADEDYRDEVSAQNQ